MLVKRELKFNVAISPCRWLLNPKTKLRTSNTPTQPLTHSLTYPLTHSPTQLPTHSHPLIHSPTPLLIKLINPQVKFKFIRLLSTQLFFLKAFLHPCPTNRNVRPTCVCTRPRSCCTMSPPLKVKSASFNNKRLS